MGKHDVAFDADVFVRTGSLFSVKRDTFPPEAVTVLAGEVIRRLTSDSRRSPRFNAPIISEANLAAFCAALVQPDPDAALRFIENRRAEGVTRQDIYLGYIGAAARYLGKRWDEDRLSFFEVTTGTGHLYALMRALRLEQPSSLSSCDTRRCALFATVPGEDHGIGITVAADLFREEGWEIDLQTDTDHDGLIAHVERMEPHIIGLSLSSAGRLDALVRSVVAMRIVMPHAIIGVAPGRGLDAEMVRGLVDIDLVFEDAHSACDQLERLIRLRG